MPPSLTYPLHLFDVDNGTDHFQFFVSSYVGNPYNPTKTGVIQRINDKFSAAGFTINSVTLYQEYVDTEPL